MLGVRGGLHRVSRFYCVDDAGVVVLGRVCAWITLLHDGCLRIYDLVLTVLTQQENNSASPKRAGPKNPPNSSSASSKTQKRTPTPKALIPAT